MLYIKFMYKCTPVRQLELLENLLSYFNSCVKLLDAWLSEFNIDSSFLSPLPPGVTDRNMLQRSPAHASPASLPEVLHSSDQREGLNCYTIVWTIGTNISHPSFQSEYAYSCYQRICRFNMYSVDCLSFKPSLCTCIGERRAYIEHLHVRRTLPWPHRRYGNITSSSCHLSTSKSTDDIGIV